MGGPVTSLGTGAGDDLADVLTALTDADGSRAHRHTQIALGVNFASSRPADISDAAHYLCILHGRHPGVIDHAAIRSADNAARAWLVQAMEGFATERAFLTRLTVAAGPAPSTAGQSECDATVLGQCHALEMLAQSDRRGCAIGAALALVLDWASLRPLLDRIALRMDIEPRPSTLPERPKTLEVARALGTDPAVNRAMLFGAGQLLRQHRGLWDLLQARAGVRAGA
jgi:hypothetical protein